MANNDPITPEPNPNPPVPPNPSPPVPYDPLGGPFNWKRFVPTNWQSILGAVGINALVSVLLYFGVKAPVNPVPVPTPVFEGKFGWVPPTPEETAAALASPNVFQFAKTESAEMNLADEYKGPIYLWKYSVKSRGAVIPTWNQLDGGTCVGEGFGMAVNVLVTVQAATKKTPTIDPAIDIAGEVIYGGSRVNVNGGRSPFIGDGSTGAGAAKFITEYGVAARGVYGPDDVTKYSVSKARELGRRGIRGELLAECKKNIVGSAALVRSADEAEKALRNLYPVAICSDVGFAGQSSRDKDGYLRESPLVPWGHCMVCLGVRDKGEGFLILNSWGSDWVGGPTGPGEPPPGSFWITRATMDKICKQGDSYAISDVKGFPRKTIRPEDWVVFNPVGYPVKPSELFDSNKTKTGKGWGLYASITGY